MRISGLTVENYRPYHGRHDINFGPWDPNRNFIVIEGGNGSGKSSLLNAITWCLYEDEIHLREEDKPLPLLNTRCLSELEAGEETEVRVDLQLVEEEDGTEYQFSRILPFRKTEDEGLVAVEPRAKFELRYREGTDWKITDAPGPFIRRRMPGGIKEYFFFDGERLDEYFRGASGENIKQAVFNISQLALLETTLDHLEEVKSDYYDEAEDASPEIDRLQKQYDSFSNTLTELQDELEEIDEEIDTQKSIISEISTKLRKYNSEDVRSLQMERENLEDRLLKAERRLNQAEADRNENVLDHAPAGIAAEPIKWALAQIRSHEASGEIPSPYKSYFIDDLLESGKCICGLEFDQHPEHREALLEFRDRTSTLSDIGEELTRGQAVLESCLDEYSEFHEAQLDISKRIRDAEQEREDINKTLKDVSDRLEDINEEEVDRLERKLQRSEDEKDDLTRRKGRLEGQIESALEKKNQTERDLDKELKKRSKHQKIRARVKFCSKAHSVGEGVRDQIMERVRKRIEEQTERQFLDLIWKQETFNRVSIDAAYNVRVEHRESGLDALGSLSAGERQVLALSFMAALNEVSGFSAPIVIDTPLGRISGGPKANIARNLPDYLTDRQVTLLVTDEEYTDEVRKLISSRVSKEYRISVSEDAEGTTSEVLEYERED